MIVKLLIELIYSVASISYSLIPDIPALPEEVYDYVDVLSEYVGVGLGIFSNYTHLSYLLSLFSVVCVVEVSIFAYKFIMWVLRKIPVAGVS